MLGQYTLAGFTLGSIDISAFIASQSLGGGGGRRHIERLTEGQAAELRRRLQAQKKRRKEQEEALEEQALEALERELEAQILAMLEAWPEEEVLPAPEPYRASLPVIQAFGFGQTVADQARIAEIMQQMEMVSRKIALEQQMREQDDEEAMLLLQ